MPTTITDLQKEFNLPEFKKVKWNERIRTQEEGVYIISLSDQSSINNNRLKKAPISEKIIENWIIKLGGFELDKQNTSDVNAIIERMNEFWYLDETIIYIGKAPRRSNGKGIGNRVNEFYKTEYGAKRPHAGGHWLKSLSNLDECFVYYCSCNDSGELENKLLNYFQRNISSSILKSLRDDTVRLPFGNLELNKGQVKKHGLRKMKK